MRQKIANSSALDIIKKPYNMKNIIYISIGFLALTVIFSALKAGKIFLPSSSSLKDKQHISTTPYTEKNPFKNLPRSTEKIVQINLLHQTQNLRLLLQLVNHDAEINLISNFNNKLRGTEIVLKNKCGSAINGGFYQKNNKPLGLFYTKQKSYHPEINNSLTNGFFWQTITKKRGVDYTHPSLKNLKFILQSGPLFILPSKKDVSIFNDKPARRSLVGQTEKDELILIEIHDATNSYSGPLLAQIPSMLSRKEVQDKFKLKKALNLDGGSASFFFSNQKENYILLEELAPIGSLFCIR